VETIFPQHDSLREQKAHVPNGESERGPLENKRSWRRRPREHLLRVQEKAIGRASDPNPRLAGERRVTSAAPTQQCRLHPVSGECSVHRRHQPPLCSLSLSILSARTQRTLSFFFNRALAARNETHFPQRRTTTAAPSLNPFDVLRAPLDVWRERRVMPIAGFLRGS
jgi:hypothetical protein